MAEVVLREITQRYPGAAADTLTGLDLRIERGEAHALLGGSGAGKSTLVNLLSGLIVPSAGSITFDGRDVTRVRPRDRGVAQVFQFPVLYPAMTVAQLLAFPLTNRGWRRDAVRQRVERIAGRLELTPWLGARTGELNLFEKQLVAIGRALIRPDVDLVLLDEPLTAVQPATKWQLRRAIRTLQQEQGVTLVYVTHDQTEALTFADRISVVRDGGILQTGAPEELYETPAHEHVAHFIGSPGMNLLQGEARDGGLWVAGERLGAAPPAGLAAGPCVVGFRPEWARLSARPDGAVRVTGTRVLGVERHCPVGIVSAELGGQTLHTRQVVDLAAEDAAGIDVEARRLLCFRDGRLVGVGADR